MQFFYQIKLSFLHRRYYLRLAHKIVFTDEFECVGYLLVLMNMFTIIIYWIPTLEAIYDNEIRQCNYLFLALYILETLLKVSKVSECVCVCVIQEDFLISLFNTSYSFLKECMKFAFYFSNK